MFENPWRVRQTTNVPKILDLNSSSEQMYCIAKIYVGAPGIVQGETPLRGKLAAYNGQSSLSSPVTSSPASGDVANTRSMKGKIEFA